MPEQDQTSRVDPLLQPLLDFWTAQAGMVAEASKSMLQSTKVDDDPNEWRRKWLTLLSKNMDAYLRSPFFLQIMKTHIDTLIAAKRRGNQHANFAAEDSGTTQTGNLDDMQDRLSKLEETLLGRLAQIETRIGSIESALRISGESE